MKQVQVRHFREGEEKPDPLAMVKVSDEAAATYANFPLLGLTVDVRRVRPRKGAPCKIEVQLVHAKRGVWDSYLVPDHGGPVDNAPRLAVEHLLLSFDRAAFEAWSTAPEKA